jgi:protocatechuate 3,4-dioxygenase beta subunit
VLGPFFAHGAKEYGYGGDLRVGCTVKGEDVWVSGRVLGTDGKPVPNAVLDIWQAKADGIYDVQEADAEFELRGRVKANAEGRIRLSPVTSRSSTRFQWTGRSAT